MMSTLQSYIYEDLNPKIENMDTPESHLLIVHIPDGFTKGDIGAKVEYDFGRVRVFGERSSGSNKRIRFNEKYQVPSHCDIGNIRGKLDGKTITIIMPNIPGKLVPHQDSESNVESEEDSTQQNVESNVESEEDSTQQDAQKVTTSQRGLEEISQKDEVTKADSKGETYHENATSQDAAKESISQKDQQEISKKESVTQKGQEKISQKESITQKGREEISQNAPVPQKDHEEISQNALVPQKVKEEISQNESLSQKGREEVSQKESIPEKVHEEISQESQATKVESKGKPRHDPSTTSEGLHESMPQKSQDQGTTDKVDKVADTKDAKLQTEETTLSPKDENKENQKLVKEETKDHLKKTIESENPYVVDDSSSTLEEETKEESKESATVETSSPKKTYIEKGKEIINEKFRNDDDDDEKKSDKKGIHELTRKRIKDMALSTTQAVTNYAKSFNEEDKQKLIYTGATILVLALGVYASYKYRSSRRP